MADEEASVLTRPDVGAERNSIRVRIDKKARIGGGRELAYCRRSLTWLNLPEAAVRRRCKGSSASGTFLLPMKLHDLIAPKLPRFAQQGIDD
jgi:hypothetical protein